MGRVVLLELHDDFASLEYGQQLDRVHGNHAQLRFPNGRLLWQLLHVSELHHFRVRRLVLLLCWFDSFHLSHGLGTRLLDSGLVSLHHEPCFLG